MKGSAGISKEYKNIKDFLEKAPSSDEAINDMKGEIDELARRAGVMIDSMKHREPQKLDFYEQYFLEIGKFRSDMKSLLKFLHELQISSGMLRVLKLNLTPDKGNAIKGSILITKAMLPPEPTSE